MGLWFERIGLALVSIKPTKSLDSPHGQFDGQVKSFFEAVHPDDRAAVAEASRAALAGNGPTKSSTAFFVPTGRSVGCNQLAEVIRDQNGLILQMIGVVRDITARP